MTLRRVGVGCGSRDLSVPNVCRLLIGEAVADEPDRDSVLLLETNIDHLTPEELAIAAERLREEGALDVWQTPVVMKKGRAAIVLSALATPETSSRLAEQMIAETGTLGVRILPAMRRLVEREVTQVETSLGPARFKVATLPGRGRVLRVESDDAARIAADRGMSADAAARALEEEAASITGIQPMHRRQSC